MVAQSALGHDVDPNAEEVLEVMDQAGLVEDRPANLELHDYEEHD